MDLPLPFEFSSRSPRRKHGPGGYRNYHQYKDWLRDEFTFRCVYCLERERWYPSGHAAFAVEHIVPVAKQPDLQCDYDNLAYACLRCNSFKQDIETLDPSRIALGEHVAVAADGSIVARTPEGREFILLLHLNEPRACELRRTMISILQLRNKNPDDATISALFDWFYGYPDDLPDLRSKRADSNSRPEGIPQCYFVLRLEGRLPKVY